MSQSSPRLILASTSPRRQALLRQMGLSFAVVAPQVDEQQLAQEAAPDYVRRLAVAKAEAGYAHVSATADTSAMVVIGADTIVVVDDEILGKPCGQKQGIEMLLRLSARSHLVMTTVAVYDGNRVATAECATEVTFRPINVAEAAAYCATGEGADKAGSYGIQGIGGIFAERIDGSYSAVVGLPMAQTELVLRKFNIDTWSMRIDG